MKSREETQDEVAELRLQITKLTKINAALMSRVERSVDQQFNAFSLFETAIALDHQVRRRTQELQQAMRSVERAKQQAEAASSLKSIFLTSVSHDLLQPLNAARLTLSALAELNVSDDAKHLVEQVDRGLVTLEDLIRTLLDLSKLDAGVMKPEIHAFPLSEVLDPMVKDFTYFAKKRGLKLRIMPSKRVVVSDPLMLRRILQNLLANALRYTTTGGVLLGARQRGDKLLVQICDTGPGIPESRRDWVFHEFQREDTSADGPAGFGLGLSIVRRFSHVLDHPVSLQSEVGRGSTFSVLIPLGTMPVVEQAPVSAMNGAGILSHIAGAKILLIENEPAVSEAMVSLLELWGCDVAVAASGTEALEKVQALGEVPNVIIADLHLNNGERGTKAIAAVRAQVGAHVPALVVTADHSTRAAQEVAAQNLEILKKPIRPAELRSLLSFLLQ